NASRPMDSKPWSRARSMPHACAAPNWREAEMRIRTSGLKALALASVLPLLGACSGGQAPTQAQFVPPTPAVAELGGQLRARYTLVPTLALDQAMARGYGIERREGTALLLVALRRDGADGMEAGIDGQVHAQARDLSGRHRAVAMRRISTGEYVGHVGLEIGRASCREIY